MVFSSGINNSGGMPQIGGSAGEFVRPGAGRPYQMWLNALNGYLYYDNGTSWNILKADPINPYTFGTGLTNEDYNISVNLSTGSSEGSQNVVGGNVIDPGAYLNLRANAGIGTGSYLNFYSIAPGTRFFQDTGNWNFGGSTDTGFLANFASEVQFEGDITCNNVFGNNGAVCEFSKFSVNGDPGSAIIILKRNVAVTPTQQDSKTIFFADGSGKLSWFNGNASYQRTFDATGITAARTWTLPDETTTLAGLSVANVFTAAQTFPAGSAAATSINGGTANTGLRFTSTGIYLSCSGADKFSIDAINGFSFATSGSMGSNFISFNSIRVSGNLGSPGNLTFNTSGGDFGLLQFGGTSASFPALKRSTTKLQARLADDSAFANIQGKLQTDTNYTAGVQVPTGYITIYDAAGTAYKVSCNV